MYKLIRPLLFKIDAERAHGAAIALGGVLGKAPFRPFVKSLYSFRDERLRVRVLGADFENPLGLAAGFDKNAEALSFFASLGFGFIEVGTVTPLPQPGNPRPRIFRLKEDEALVNRLGFNSKGMKRALECLKDIRDEGIIVGVNIGKNKLTPNAAALSDYEKCFESLADYARYIMVNVSSPNTPHLRELQERKPLTRLLQGIQALNFRRARPRPILVKIAPDLNESQLDDVLDIAKDTNIQGVVATNTTVLRDGLVTPKSEIEAAGEGGLSGKPLRKRSTEIIRYLFRRSKGAIPIVGVGGIFSPEDAYEKICAGASLVQLYTGLIYEGPGIARRINKGLLRLLERDGLRSIQEAIGRNA
ncbi:quinone-dependent dihydroorotate dehydrogenase [Candidatus Parcubacteria bacterium]|nr:MAG: quinone-dependent dihydroorotate dehydrogenase [Candidatus Parcubacteria bacterium]